MRKNTRLAIAKGVVVFREFSYDEGVSAFRNGLALSANPYKLNTSDHLIWRGGWMEAKKGSVLNE